jgi:mycofactocin precursor
VLNYRAPTAREERSIAMSSTPEQTIAREETPEEDTAQQPADDKELVVEDLLVEDVSIDGMCGVY